ncbi:hypothetical protein [Sphaerisporangium corydalis]|uniref:Serine/arginine repetitive matrix protein 2 n=1 Tax=Sphaerisporangium corydalis TaxID=1441875 RepID=A0ABV9E5B0_9ACTN|nr:hypothetical protein [Sphaerisporangium corydalis]
MTENDPRPNDETARPPRSPSPGGPYGPPSYNAPSGAPGHGGPPGYGPPGGGYGGPGHGAPPPGFQQRPGYGAAPPARVPVKPSVLWIVLAWIIAVVCIGFGVAGFAGSLVKTVNDLAPTQTFEGGATISAVLDPKDKPVLYASVTTSAPGGTSVTCLAQDASGGKASLTRPVAAQTISANGRVWELMFNIGVPAPGTYTIGCQAEGDNKVLFGVGKSLTASAGTLVGGVASLIVLPLGGFLFAVIVTIVVLVRRNRSRKRQAAAPYGGGWPQGTPPGA